ncbi:hypothetical protein NL50_10525 [Clostridium acetobutylicum]|nr:hypothetical protein NL50_10525 [Clostridium acetobutylicum]
MIDIKTNYTTNGINANKVTDNSATVPSEKNSNNNSTTDKTQISTNVDTVDISEASKNITTAQKAKKAFDDTLANFKNFSTDQGDLSFYVGSVINIMRDLNIHPVPEDILSNPNAQGSFSNFVDTLKNFAQKQNYIQLPKQFFNFCDELKQNFIINGLN